MTWLDLNSHAGPEEDVHIYMNYVSRWPLFAMMMGAATCMLFSAIFHLFYVKSPTVSAFLARLDYAGISILACGSSMPGINYHYACGPAICKLIISMLMIIYSFEKSLYYYKCSAMFSSLYSYLSTFIRQT
jgi:predicted membrane channel-forming protein YqfA (hemolysin III family)